MSLYVIDTDRAITTTAEWFDEVVQLEGIEYRLEFLWSARESCWYMNLLDQDENGIGNGIKLVASAQPPAGGAKDLLRRFRTDPRCPPGVLFLIDTLGKGVEISAQADLGARHELNYVSSDDPAIAGVNLGVFA